MKDQVFEADTVDSALALASRRLGLPVAELRYVVLEKETGGGLGLRPTPARVAILLDRPQPPARRPETPPRPARPASASADVETPAAVTPAITPARPEERIVAVVEAWAEDAALDLAARVTETGTTFVVELHGEDRAELTDGALDALAHLLQRVVAATRAEHRGVVLECGGRRLGRDEALQQRAREMVAEVRASGAPREIGPLNAYERRLVHLVVRDASGVTSYSVGEGAERRVTIAPLPEGGGTEVM
jgi:spoIIIJ-associated protein